MLGDTSALDEWAAEVDPPLSVWRAVSEWVEGLAEAPWQYPSTPFPELSDQPEYEHRSAVVPGTFVEVFYRHTYPTGVVDIIGVR